jgi:transducin (beta)-like 1
MIRLTSTELNYLLYRYLVEEGLTHSAFIFGKETSIADHPSPPEIPPGALKKYVLGGLEMEYVERHSSEGGSLVRCTSSYNLSAVHQCRMTPTTVTETRLESVGADVSLCAWSENGLLATGSKNCIARVWNLPELIGEWSLEKSGVANHGITGVAISSGSTFGGGGEQYVLAASSHMGELLVARGEREWRVAGGHKGPIVAVALRGDKALTGGWDGICSLWEGRGEELVRIRSWNNHMGPVMDLIWREENTFLSCSADGTICVVEDEKVFRLTGHEGEVNAIKMGGEEIVSSSDDKTLRIWSLGGASSVLRGHTKEVYALDVVGNTIASGSFDGSVRLWDKEKEFSLAVLENHSKAVYTVSFNHEGNILASGGLDGVVCFWDVRNKELIREHNIHHGVYQVSFSPLQNALAVCSADTRPVVLELGYDTPMA